MLRAMMTEQDPNEILSSGRKDIPDMPYSLIYRVKPYCVEFEIHQAESEDADGHLQFLPGGETWTEFSSDPTEESQIAEGYVKWDGCVNWTAGRGIMVHCCEREQFVGFGQLFAECYDLGKLCPNWDER